MSNPIQVISLAEFAEMLAAWQVQRQIDSVHLHCTDRPRHADFRGLASIEAMRKYHRSIGMSDIAQHLTIDPNGLLWTGRPFDQMPASVRGHNGSAQRGPFMIEMVGLFEKNVDTLHGAQLSSVQSVICQVLRKFGLDDSKLMFHREFPNTGKTCPGLDLDPKKFRKDIKALLASNQLRDFDVALPSLLPDSTRDANEREASIRARDFSADDERDFSVPEDALGLQEQMVLAKWIDRGVFDDDDGARSVERSGCAVDPEFASLIGHVINTSQGALSKSGKFCNDIDDVRLLIEQHLIPAFESGHYRHLVFYAHGGLVSESSALCYVKTILPWWKSYGVYPIFFTWESGLFSTIFKSQRVLAAGARGLSDFTDKAVEVATQLLARPVWARMKANARGCSSMQTEHGVPGGLFQFANLLRPWLLQRQTEQKEVNLHAIGHSTGPILQASFMPLLINSGLRFKTLSYLAPAILIEDFARDVRPKIGQEISNFAVYTMEEKAERDDNVAQLYRKSLLYYVRDACEDRDDGKLIGLQEDLFDDATMKTLFGLRSPSDLRASKGAAAIEFSQRKKKPQNALTAALSHGGFDNDKATMLAVLERILNVPPTSIPNAKAFPSAEQFKRCEDTQARGLDSGEGIGASSGCSCQDKTASTSAFDLADGEDELSESATWGNSVKAKGRKRALCIGIDRYPSAPLSGCVNDAHAWEKQLRILGFSVKSLVNEQATRAGILAALGELIEGANSGDELLLQYSGHGTQVKDDSGDEADLFDEALVPIDYQQGQLLLDDDLDVALRKLPSGAYLSLFMDCCHSGTNVRAAPVRKRQDGAVNRFLKLDSASLARFQAIGRARNTRADAGPAPRVISFAACLDREVALERNGQGDFTRHALAMFARSHAQNDSNQAFLRAVLKAFGESREQTPMIAPTTAALKARRLLGGQ